MKSNLWITKKEYNLLVEIYKTLYANGSRPDLASSLLNTIKKLSDKLEKAGEENAEDTCFIVTITDNLATENVAVFQDREEAEKYICAAADLREAHLKFEGRECYSVVHGKDWIEVRVPIDNFRYDYWDWRVSEATLF